MNFNKFMEDFAQEIGGQFSEYDKSKSIVVYPLGGNRFQTVVGIIKPIGKNSRAGIEFSSKVCSLTDEVNLKDLLEENNKLLHAKFSVNNGFVQIQASALLESATDRMLKDIISEVAQSADEWEYRITGMDVH